jgi:GNAT superfamily N-acetyltransferase
MLSIQYIPHWLSLLRNDDKDIIVPYFLAMRLLAERCEAPFGDMSKFNKYMKDLKHPLFKIGCEMALKEHDLWTPNNGVWVLKDEEDTVVGATLICEHQLDRIAVRKDKEGKGYAKQMINFITKQIDTHITKFPFHAPVAHHLVPLFKSCGWESVNDIDPFFKQMVDAEDERQKTPMEERMIVMFPPKMKDYYRDPSDPTKVLMITPKMKEDWLKEWIEIQFAP